MDSGLFFLCRFGFSNIHFKRISGFRTIITSNSSQVELDVQRNVSKPAGNMYVHADVHVDIFWAKHFFGLVENVIIKSS